MVILWLPTFWSSNILHVWPPIFLSKNIWPPPVYLGPPFPAGGYLVQKTLRGCAANTGRRISLLVYEWVDFSKLGQIWAKIGSNLRKFWKKLVILFKIWPKIGPIVIWMGYFFLKNWYLYGSTFKFHGGTSLPKPNLSTPRAPSKENANPPNLETVSIDSIHLICYSSEACLCSGYCYMRSALV